ncbi:MAG: alpha/beta hydrolase [Halioglobus sp.]
MSHSSLDDPSRERCWDINGLKLSGLSWGDPDGRPLLMLHGWLDNAASFSLLAPLLDQYHVIALDLTGQGHSSHRSADANYHIWDDLPEIMGVVEQLGWDSFDLLGHSRGAIISTLLASAYPERIKRLVLLDAIIPEPVTEAAFPAQLRMFLDQKPALLDADNSVYESLAAATIIRKRIGLTNIAAQLISERGLVDCPDGVTWRTDRRLQGASAVKLTTGQTRAVLDGLTMPTLLLLAEGGRMTSAAIIATLDGHPTLQLEYVVGGHHFHLEPPLDTLVSQISRFLGESNR